MSNNKDRHDQEGNLLNIYKINYKSKIHSRDDLNNTYYNFNE
jgi:hypothetical protein